MCSKSEGVQQRVKRVCSKGRVAEISKGVQQGSEGAQRGSEGVQYFGGCAAFWRVCNKFGTLGGCVVRLEGVQ